ncbi:MAG: antitoxin VapB family protein [Thermoplasmatota archaeon]
MSFKSLTIKTSVYQKLLSIKRDNESFSDLFELLSKNNIATLQKLRECTEFDNKDQMLLDMKNERNEKRYV